MDEMDEKIPTGWTVLERHGGLSGNNTHLNIVACHNPDNYPSFVVWVQNKQDGGGCYHGAYCHTIERLAEALREKLDLYR